MDVKEWISYKCSDEETCTQNIHNSSTRSHPLEEENRARNPDTPDAIRQRDAIFRYSLTDNFDSSLNFLNI
jgi:hypothetical protein